MKNNHTIIIKKVKKGGHAGHHGGAWKIAYADFMTAMMALFLVMWLIAKSTPSDLRSIAEYFRTPLKVAITGGARSTDSNSPIPGGGDDSTKISGEVQHGVATPDIEPDEITEEELDAQQDRAKLRQLAEEINKVIQLDPRLQELRPHLIINLTEMGLRIQIVDRSNRPMFKLGSDKIEPHMKLILDAIAPILNDMPNKIVLSGHTDERQYSEGDKGYSNWELSSDRATASKRELVKGGLNPNKIMMIIGMASTLNLKDPRFDDASNRRISLLILSKTAQENIEKERAIVGEDVLTDEIFKLPSTPTAPEATVPPAKSSE